MNGARACCAQEYHMTRIKDSDTGVFVRAMLDDGVDAPLHEKASEFVASSQRANILDMSNARRVARLYSKINSENSASHALSDASVDRFDMDAAIAAYRSIGDSIASHYLKVLPTKVQGWLAQARNWLLDEGMGFYVAATFLGGLKRTTSEMTEGAPRDSIGSLYTGPLGVITDFHRDLGRSVIEYLGGLGISGAVYMQRWLDALRETGDIIHDSEAIVRDVDLTFFYLRYMQNEKLLGDSLDLLRIEGFDRVDTAVSSIRRLGLIRSDNSKVAVQVGWMPSLAIPEEFRSDFIRAMHALIHNGVQYHDKDHRKNKKGERSVDVVSLTDGPLLRISVMDNGRGERGIKRHLGPDRNGGLAVAKRIADKNGWRLEISSNQRIGTQASLAIDTGEWSSTPDPVSGGKTTLPGPAPAPAHGAAGFISSGWSPGLVSASMMAGIRIGPIN